MNHSPKPLILFAAIILVAGAAAPSSAVAGMICASLENFDQPFPDCPVEETGEETPQKPEPKDFPPVVDLPDAPEDAGTGASRDVSTQSGPTSPALHATPGIFGVSMSLSYELNDPNPPRPSPHLSRLFRPPRLFA